MYDKIKMPRVSFDSKLVQYILELEKLKDPRFISDGTTPYFIFKQLKNVFHFMESVHSARIEGNNTTVSQYAIEKSENVSRLNQREDLKEISNLEDITNFISEDIENLQINRLFISELHKRVTASLNREGSKTPGSYRKENVKINKSNHTPPDHTQVNDYMDELFSFINGNYDSRYDLLVIALAHHRFAWIHPFDNGNGRVARLLTYAMLLKKRYSVSIPETSINIINMSAVFCLDRNDYYEKLSQADDGKDEGLLSWSEYMLSGLLTEFYKIGTLLNYNFLLKNILVPSVINMAKSGLITEKEEKILGECVVNRTIKSSDLQKMFPNKTPRNISYMLKKLKDRNLLKSLPKNKTTYYVNFESKESLIFLVRELNRNGFAD